MSKEIYISSTPHETRLAIVENDELTEIYYERENEYTLAGSIYNGRVTRVLPGMQSSFVDVGLERDAFLYITDFLEEAPDSAEFDTADAGGSADRRGRSRGDRDRGRPAREDGAPTPALTDASEPAAQPADRREGRGEGRNEGRNEGRGEGRGDRRRRGDRGGARESLGSGTAPVEDRPLETVAEPEGREATAAAGELGEGAPGADGSRRWRGRRGRRRGRGAAGREAGLPAGGGEAVLMPGTGTAGDEEDEEALEFDAAAESAAAEAAYDTPPADAALSDSDPYERGSRRGDGRRDSTRRDQDGSGDRESRASRRGDLSTSSADAAPGDRDLSGASDDLGKGATDEGRESRGGSGDRSRRGRDSRPPRAPRGFSPSRSLYGVESEEETEGSAAGADPIVLPGESLAKYRGDAAPAGSAAPLASPAPASEFVLPGGWDGGAVLPGETLRPRTRPADEDREDRPSGDRDRRDAGGRDRGGRDRGARRDARETSPRERDRTPREGDRTGRDRDRSDQRPRGDRSGAPTSTVAREDASSAKDPSPRERADDYVSFRSPAGTPAGYSAAPAEAPARELQVEASAVSPSPAPALMKSLAEPSGVFERIPETLGEVHASAELAGEAVTSEIATQPAPSAGTPAAPVEYEPTEASASHRFDPVPPSEYRQPATTMEPEPADRDPDAATTAEAESAPPAAMSTHLITPPAGVAVHPLVLGTEHAPEMVAHAVSAEVPAHEFTELTPSGEMLSEMVTPEPQEIAAPTSPLQHETAVLDAHKAGEGALPEVGGTIEAAEITEEAIEEDFQTTTLHAASIEEMDYDEEETLEGAADLGSMIREMTIDHITEPGEDAAAESFEEDVDFEELDSLGDDDAHESTYVAGHLGLDEEEAHDHEQDERPAAADGEYGREAGRDLSLETGNGTSDDAHGEDGGRDGRRLGRRDGRRDGRRGSRGDERARSTGGAGDHSSGMRPSRRDHRHSAQTTNLPAISDLLKPGQELLVQIAKEPIAKKGARITSHIALPGRFLVFMPTVNHTGVSRKIESDGERRRLKEILLSERGEASGGFIVRTAAAGASEEELRSDLRFLLNLWTDIKQRSESSKSPALIYHDLNLVERILRDQVTDTFSAIWVDTETEYERVLRFLQRFQPSLIRRVKLYSKEAPLFEQFGLTEEINKALRSKVWLKSGGSIVINQTEALVAIDINTGKYVGKTARLEDTIVKTNLDAIPEIVRQIRLRDLGGIIIIDFIDMDERKNRHKVMAVLEEELKKDRAPSKVLQFNDFGLVAITRKRVKQSLERTLSTTCGICAGTGMVKSPVTVCNDIYIEMRKMQKHLDRGDVMLRVNPEVVKQLKSPTARWLQEMEEMVGKTILVKSDPALHPEQFDIH